MNLQDLQIKKLESLAKDLNGNLTYLTTLDHSGRTSKKVVLEYDIKQKK